MRAQGRPLRAIAEALWAMALRGLRANEGLWRWGWP